jgi:epoxyqueuosine reductase
MQTLIFNPAPALPDDPKARARTVKAAAAALGFDTARWADVSHPWPAKDRLADWLEAGHHADMEWMATHADRRSHPRALWPAARTALVLGMNYGPERDPMSQLDAREQGAISVYAMGRDYHDLMKKRLKQLASWYAGASGEEVKIFVDTAPLMEKPLAEQAGIGWQGKHTVLVSRDLGNWLFLGVMLTTDVLPPDAPETDHCGSCRKCLDICPTNAFPAPYVLDARRCIAYLTNEHKGHIDRDLRGPMGNRIYGCDDCLAVCPWNKFAQTTREASFLPRPGTDLPDLEMLSALDDAGFRALYAGSPIKRIGRARFVRNVMIAIGNSGARRLVPCVVERLADDSPLVRVAAIWALARLDEQTFVNECARRLSEETAPDEKEEWEYAIKG